MTHGIVAVKSRGEREKREREKREREKERERRERERETEREKRKRERKRETEICLERSLKRPKNLCLMCVIFVTSCIYPFLIILQNLIKRDQKPALISMVNIDDY